MEAEYMVLTRAMKQILWMHAAMDEVGYPQPKPAILYNDNSGAVLLTQNTKNNTKVKHINIRYHYIRERVEEGEIEVRHVASANNLADMFTKQLPRVAFQKHCAALRLYESPLSQRGYWSRPDEPDDTIFFFLIITGYHA